MADPKNRPKEGSSRAQINASAWGEGKGKRERKVLSKESLFLISSYLGDKEAGSSVESKQAYYILGACGKT